MDHYVWEGHCGLDPDDGERPHVLLGRAWEKDHGVPERRSCSRGHQATLRRCRLTYLDHPCAVAAVCDEPVRDAFRLLLPHKGQVENSVSGRRAVAKPAMAVLHAPGQGLDFSVDERAIDPSRLLLLGIDGDVARQALTRRFAAMPTFEAWASAFPLDTPAAATLCSFCHWLAQELERPGSPLRANQRVIDCLERTLVAFFVELLAARHPSLQGSPEDLAEWRLAQIEAWIEQHLGEPFGVEDLAAVADISARSVQITFRQWHGCTPMQFVLRRRLQRARELLQKAEPQTTVTSVAAECGVFQFGRFAAQYRARFGEKPSETLGRIRATGRFGARSENSAPGAEPPVQIAKWKRSATE